jgi:thiaminase
MQIAIAPCLVGYGVIGARLHADPKTAREGNRYWKWVTSYAAEGHQAAARASRGRHRKRRRGHKSCAKPSALLKELLEQHAVKQSPGRIEELVKIFIHATRVGLPNIVSITQG